MPVLEMLAVLLVPEGRPQDVFETAWIPDTDPKDFFELVRSHFKAKDLVYLFKDKFSIPFNQLCTKLSKRVSGELSTLEGEYASDDIVYVPATIRITPEASAHTSPDATVAVPATVAKAEIDREGLNQEPSASTRSGNSNKIQTKFWHRMCKIFLIRLSPCTKDGRCFMPVSACTICERCMQSCPQSVLDQRPLFSTTPVFLQHSSVGNMKNDDPMKQQLLLAIDCTFQMIKHECARNGCDCPAEYGANGLRSKLPK